MWKIAGPSDDGKVEGWLEKAVFINPMSATGEMRINKAVSARRAHHLGVRLYSLDMECRVINAFYNLLKVFARA